jgi:hypothetical protein
MNHGRIGHKARRTGPPGEGRRFRRMLRRKPSEERITMSKIVERVLNMSDVLGEAGYPADSAGKTNIPNTQGAAEKIGDACARLLGGTWQPGDDRLDLILTGAAPVWAYMMVWHVCHGRCVRLTYASPAATIIAYSHGL